MAIIFYNKKYTETLAIMLERFRSENSEYRESKITYAGRLDPMAEGLMILLTDDDVHKKEEYLGKDKVYEVDFFFGASTDTLDILGLLNNRIPVKEIFENEIRKSIIKLENIDEQEYPHYSSKTFSGTPLWKWSREGRLNEITVPKRKVEIYNAKYLGTRNVKTIDFKNKIIHDIALVEGDFRQNEIASAWSDYFKSLEKKSIDIYTLRLHVSSGTYVRSLIQELGVLMNIPTTTLRIKRTQIEGKTLT